MRKMRLLFVLLLTASALAVPHGQGGCPRSKAGGATPCRMQGAVNSGLGRGYRYVRSPYYYGFGGGSFQGYGNSQPSPSLAPGQSVPGYQEPLKTSRKDGVLPGYQNPDRGKSLPGY